MSIGNIKGFLSDVVKNVLIVAAVSYIGGATLMLKDKDLSTLPIDIKKYPYVDDGKEKTELFSLQLFTQFGFPYDLINDKKGDSYNDVKVWLAMTCATFFIYIRKLLRILIKNIEHYYPTTFGNLFFYYLFPTAFLYLLKQPQYLIGFFSFIVFLCALWLENSLIIASPLCFPWWVYRGGEASIMKLILVCIFFWIGICFVPLYLVWWNLLACAGFLYVAIFYLFSPFSVGFDKIIKEAGKHKLTLSILFMLLTLYSASVYITSTLVKSGMIVACIYWFYSWYFIKS